MENLNGKLEIGLLVIQTKLVLPIFAIPLKEEGVAAWYTSGTFSMGIFLGLGPVTPHKGSTTGSL